MPIDYEVDEERSFVTTRFYGRVTNRDVSEHVDRIQSDPRYRTGVRELLLTDEISELDITPDAIFSAGMKSASKSKELPGIRIALCAKSQLAYGLARIFTSLTGDSEWETRVFRDRDEAEAWLFRGDE